MNIGIDIDGTLIKYPRFFTELGRLWKERGYKVYVITGLGPDELQRRMKKWGWIFEDEGDWYDGVYTTALYNNEERALIGKELDNEKIVGRFKQRMCKELGVHIMFDDKVWSILPEFGDIPIFEVK